MAITSVTNLSVYSNGPVDKAIARKMEKSPDQGTQDNPVEGRGLIKLTELAKGLQKISSEELRPEKVKEIKERLARGEYQPDSHKIAQKLLEDELALA